MTASRKRVRTVVSFPSCKRQAVAAPAQVPKAGDEAKQEGGGGGVLTTLPEEICLDILRYLSPEDLAACATTCSYLHEHASDERLWRRAYCLRWGQREEDSLEGAQQKAAAQRTWKQSYFKRDAGEMAEFLKGVSLDLRHYYSQMQAVKRSTAPSLAQVHAVSLRGEKTLSEQISQWRRSRNFAEPPIHASPGASTAEARSPHQGSASGTPDASQAQEKEGGGAQPVHEHVCNGQVCSYHQIGNVYLCEKTGKAHVCGDDCGATIIDPRSELLVCVVTGRCFDRMLDPEEGHMERGAHTVEGNDEDESEEGGQDEDVEPFLGAGRLGRAFAIGYSCTSEKDLNRAQRLMGGI